MYNKDMTSGMKQHNAQQRHDIKYETAQCTRHDIKYETTQCTTRHDIKHG